MAIIEGRDPETADNFGMNRKAAQDGFRPSTPNTIEAPAKHVHMISEPIPMPETAEEKPAEEDPPEEKTEE